MHFDSRSRVLVVAAHPDDEVLGCGGTLARAAAAGAQIHVLFLGEGISARFPVGQYDSPEFREQTERRMAGSKKALAVLGVGSADYGKRLCCQFDTLPLISLVKEIESVMQSFKPTILLTHDASEVNVDHGIVFDAVENACRPTRPWIPKEICAFEIICSSSFKFDERFSPNVYVDVSATWKKKLEAWHCYEGEDRPFPFPRSDEGLATLAQFRGMAVGLAKAEAFRLIRKSVV